MKVNGIFNNPVVTHSQPLESKQQSPPPTQTSSSSSSPPYFECMVRAYTSMTSAYTDEGSLRREVRHHPSTNRDPWTDLMTDRFGDSATKDLSPVPPPIPLI